MTKQEFVQKVGMKAGLSARDAGKAVEAFAPAHDGFAFRDPKEA